MNTWFSGSIRRRASVIVALTLAVSASAGAASGRAEQYLRPPKPNLVVKAGRVSVPAAPDTGLVVTRRDTTFFVWKHLTKNIGAAPAAKSRTQLQIQKNSPRVWILPNGADLPVPTLGPNKSSQDNGAFDYSWSDGWAYGAHPTSICADADHAVNESNESDNCRKTDEIYVVPVSIDGDVDGSSVRLVDPGVTLRWRARVSFPRQNRFPDVFAKQGVFDYHFYNRLLSMRQVTYTIAGTESNRCSVVGTGTYEPDPQSDRIYIRLSFRPGTATYSAWVPFDPHFSFHATETCGGFSSTLVIEPMLYAPWFDTRGPQPLPNPWLTDLKDSSTYADSSTKTTWTWDLSPHDN